MLAAAVVLVMLSAPALAQVDELSEKNCVTRCGKGFCVPEDECPAKASKCTKTMEMCAYTCASCVDDVVVAPPPSPPAIAPLLTGYEPSPSQPPPIEADGLSETNCAKKCEKAFCVPGDESPEKASKCATAMEGCPTTCATCASRAWWCRRRPRRCRSSRGAIACASTTRSLP